MDTMQVLQTIWFFIIGFLFVGYSVLDGFDLGIGTLLPYLAKDGKETAAVFSAIGPVWDGNEVWILTAGGALFAAFPHVYATVFSGFYLALMLILFALIFRAVSLEFWSMDESRRTLWKWSFSIGSLLPSLLFGVALGNVIAGIPLNDKMEYTGDFFTLLRPFPLAVGLLGLSAILLQGCAYAVLKTDGTIQNKFRQAGKWIWIIFICCMALSLVLSAVYLPESMKNPLCWICTAAILILQIMYRISIDKDMDLLLFITSSLSFTGLWGIAGALQFPNLVKALEGPDFHLSIHNSSSSEMTLTVMLVIALIGMPFVLGYTVYVYKIFKGKVKL
jgi:cytochrome d ubiquinol oxidase subunit II